jgi:hypothetical protein
VKTRPLLSFLIPLSLVLPPSAHAQTTAEPSQAGPQPSARPASPTEVSPPRGIPAGGDVVHLKGGGMIRGTLIEILPDDHATVELATGQTAVVPWERVDRVERGTTTTQPEKAPTGSTSASAPSPGTDGSDAVVHIDADRPVVLERSEAGGAWTLVCTSPCDLPLPLSSTYRISGYGVRRSTPFSLSARGGEHVVIDVNTASRGGYVGGIVLAGAGTLVALVGALVLQNQALGQPAGASANSDARMVGWSMVAGGALMALGGVALIAHNAHSKVEPTPTPRPRSDAWLRLPTWREDRSGAGLPGAVDIPLLHRTF